mmetsp:Transcript_12450/g.16624  ORF Transcript_12450/g.16624 Transcript_12450/m.16624 type:complete len:340 (+) Transcript_12450:109-1128(+)
MEISKRSIKRISIIAAFALIGYILLYESLHHPSATTTTTKTSSFAFETNVGTLADPLKETDTPVYWHIPKASGSSMKAYYACMDLVLATQSGITQNHDQDEKLLVWKRSIEDGLPAKYVNVDATTEEGIARAKTLGLAKSGLADVVFTPIPAVATDMFDPKHHARFFALFRHPIERAVSLFYYHQVAEWEKAGHVYRPELAGMTIEEWLLRQRRGGGDVKNFLMTIILNKNQFTSKDLEKAKEIIRTKFLVGLSSKMEESVDRFDTYFGWADNEKRPVCQEEAIQSGFNKNPHATIEKGSATWNALAEVNDYDMQIYDFILELFQKQGELFGKYEVNVD